VRATILKSPLRASLVDGREKTRVMMADESFTSVSPGPRSTQDASGHLQRGKSEANWTIRIYKLPFHVFDGNYFELVAP
jgi:hypothetical protein